MIEVKRPFDKHRMWINPKEIIAILLNHEGKDSEEAEILFKNGKYMYILPSEVPRLLELIE